MIFAGPTTELARRWQLGPSLHVHACGTLLHDAMDALFGTMAIGAEPSPKPWLLLELARDPAGRLRLFANGIPIVTIEDPAELTPLIEGLVVGCTVRARPDVAAFHAAAVELAGRGVLLAGDKGSGKSTLALALSKHGARYLADEVTLVHYADLCLEAFPKAVTIKQGAFKMFSDETATHHDLLRGPLRYHRPQNAASIGFRTHTDAIIFPAWSKDQKTTEVSRLSRPEITLELVMCTFGGLERDPRVPELLRGLSGRPAYRLRYATTAGAIEALDRLVATFPGRAVELGS
jgi:hypothetical protein